MLDKVVDACPTVALLDREFFLLVVQQDDVGIVHLLYAESYNHIYMIVARTFERGN